MEGRKKGGEARTSLGLFCVDLTITGTCTVCLQNEFLKAYVSRLQKALQDSDAAGFPPPPDLASISASDSVPSWGADPNLLNPLLASYDRRIADADRVNERISVDLGSLQARAKQLSVENDRLSGEIRHLTEAAIARLEVQGVEGQGGVSSVEAEERAVLLASENEAYADENGQLRMALSKAQSEISALSQQLSDKEGQNSALRAKVVATELREAEVAAAKEVFGQADKRHNVRDDRMADELEAAQRELRVVSDELHTTRNDLRAQVANIPPLHLHF